MLETPEKIVLAQTQVQQVDELRLPLVNRFYSHSNYRVKCGRFERVYSLSYAGRIIAAARLIPQPSGHFLLRNLCVAPELRHQGLASYFLRVIVAELSPANCYCYALPHLQDFYLALDFKLHTPEQVPNDIADMYLRHCERKRGWILMGFSNSAY